ncbi:MAG TPA: hypothetical protein DIT30_00225 [Verrucomicrobiales bacterium]|nr:hypothetical protein [Verrucomicrobiales bacterium]
MNGSEGVKKFITADAQAVLAGKVKLAEELLGVGDMFFHPVDFEQGIAGRNFDAEGFFRFAKEGLIGGIEFGQSVGVIES